VKFKAGDIVRRDYPNGSVYRYVRAVLKNGHYELSGDFSTPALAMNPAENFKHSYTTKISTRYVDGEYVLDTEYKRITEFNVDLEELLSEV